MAEKKYVGNGKAIQGKYGTFYNLSLKLSDLEKLPTNDKGYIKVSMSELKQPDQYGNTHTLYENDYKAPQKINANEDVEDEQTLPF